jgi:hypothetical protein
MGINFDTPLLKMVRMGRWCLVVPWLRPNSEPRSETAAQRLPAGGADAELNAVADSFCRM